MQCPSCRAVYSNGLSLCPRCKIPASKPSAETETETKVTTTDSASAPLSVIVEADERCDSSAAVATAPATSSTLIEFPGTTRASRPQWRKDLSARVREIQERRAREADETTQMEIEQAATMETAAPQLGLVPQPDAPEVNPIVVAALKRLERARQSPPATRPRASMGGAATATARVVEERYETEAKSVLAPVSMPDAVPVFSQQPQTETAPSSITLESPREHQLTIVPDQPAAKLTSSPTKPQPRRVAAKIIDEEPQPVDDELIDEPSADEAPAEEIYDDRAPVVSRLAASLIDFLVIAFASSPFAAIIELTNGNWTDWRVIASMSGIVLVVMFLYLTASTALAGRTWGMSFVSLRPVDAETGRPPTTRQAVGRAILYIISLLCCGLGLCYALFDAEGRAVHDHLSGTIVVRD